MRVLIQRSKSSSVSINEKIVGKIDKGLVIFVGFTNNDTEEKINYLVHKIINLRIFSDDEGKMNKSILDTDGQILLISQFTLYADTNSGNRPSFKNVLNSDESLKLYKLFKEKLSEYVHVADGIFKEDMLVNIKNDGPVTIMLER